MTFSLSATAERFETRIRANRPIELPVDWADELVYPAYDGLSILNLAASMGAIFGIEGHEPLDSAVWQDKDPTGQVERVVLILTDGLGYNLLTRLVQEDSVLSDTIAELTEGRGFVPLTSAMPSTTAVALPTFWTAQPPAQNGMVGTQMFLSMASALCDMLNYTPTVDRSSHTSLEAWDIEPESFIPLLSLPEQLERVDVPTHLLLQYTLMGSGLSRILHRGVRHKHRHVGLGDSWQRLADVLMATRGQRCCISAYWPNVDALSHAYGADSPYVRGEIMDQMTILRTLLKSDQVRDGQTLVMIVADHGHYNTDQDIDLLNDDEAMPLLLTMRGSSGGDNRLPYLYLRSDSRKAASRILDEVYADRVAWIRTEEAVGKGLFGPGFPHPDLMNRLGDLILIPRLGTRILDAPRGRNFVSEHAGLSDHEMLVPFMYRYI